MGLMVDPRDAEKADRRLTLLSLVLYACSLPLPCIHLWDLVWTHDRVLNGFETLFLLATTILHPLSFLYLLTNLAFMANCLIVLNFHSGRGSPSLWPKCMLCFVGLAMLAPLFITIQLGFLFWLAAYLLAGLVLLRKCAGAEVEFEDDGDRMQLKAVPKENTRVDVL